jgi:hypothetical protein
LDLERECSLDFRFEWCSRFFLEIDFDLFLERDFDLFLDLDLLFERDLDLLLNREGDLLLDRDLDFLNVITCELGFLLRLDLDLFLDLDLLFLSFFDLGCLPFDPDLRGLDLLFLDFDVFLSSERDLLLCLVLERDLLPAPDFAIDSLLDCFIGPSFFDSEVFSSAPS